MIMKLHRKRLAGYERKFLAGAALAAFLLALALSPPQFIAADDDEVILTFDIVGK
mgnify:CR=1 FL=1